MDILDKIIAYKREEVEVRKLLVPEEELMESIYFKRTALSLKQNLLKEDSTGIIAEFKRKSPSKGFINQHADVLQVTKEYTSFGASGLSVLTDAHFFGGNTEDLVAARVNNIPILRKDFIIDRYQILAAKAMGADVVLLIAACLSAEEVKELAAYAKQTGLEILLELHDESELQHICDDIDMVGINNRNLKTFEVDIKRSLQLSALIPAEKIKIAESGINDPETIKRFRDAGYKGFLIGETFMKQPHPGSAFKEFVTQVK
ncbi:MAG: indole-3-glycerol phosphate synthase TrpC [Ferruginibacter sp.]